MISTQQKAILRQIAKEQLRSFLRIAENQLYQDLVKEMEEEGYDVSTVDILAYVGEQLELWEKVKDDPDSFTSLDEVNLGMIKHWLINDFHEDGLDTRGIWKKLNLVDKVNQNKN